MNKFIVLIFALVACFSGVARADPQQTLVTFTNAIWSNLGLSNPTAFQNCFETKSAGNFFNWMNTVYNVYTDMVTGNLSQYVLIDTVNQNNFMGQMSSNWKCAIKTSDFTNLLGKLNFATPSNFQNASTLYDYVWAWTAAYPNVVQTLLGPVINNLNSNNVDQAGSALVTLLKDFDYSGDAASKFNAYSIISFYNGLFIGLSLPFPAAAGQCFSHLTAAQLAPLKNFYDGLFKAISGTRTLETYVLTRQYYNGAGKTTYSQIPKSLWDCLNASSDTKILKSVLSWGMDPYDTCYVSSMYAFINANYDNAYEFNAILNKVWTAWLPDYYDATAYTYKQLLKDINIYAKC